MCSMSIDYYILNESFDKVFSLLLNLTSLAIICYKPIYYLVLYKLLNFVKP